jgi:ribosomal protein S18 acetylase RimI-like enzyme
MKLKLLLQEIKSPNLKYIYFDEDGGIGYESLENLELEDYEDDILDQINDIENKSGIRFTRDRYIQHILFDTNNKKVAGILYLSSDNDKFTFDVVVSNEYQNKGIAKTLIADALKIYKYDKDMYNNRIEVDAVNPIMANILKNKFNFKLKEKLPGREILTL